MNDSIAEQISRLDELTFPSNIWGLESYRKSAANDYDYLVAAVCRKAEQAAYTVIELCDGDAAEATRDSLVGYALLRCFDDAEIIRIATDPRYRRQGIGSMLLNELLREAHKRNIHSIFLEVRSSNIAAVSLYEQAGFEKAGVRRNYYSAPVEDAIIMRYTW